MTNVLIIEAQIKRYRKPFYDGLHVALRKEGIRLKVVYCPPPPSEAEKQDNCELPREYGVKVEGRWLGGERLLWQPALRHILAADLVVMDQANKLILNHFLLPMSLFKLKSVAFWGLGENVQADRSPFSEWYKERTLNWVAWWFAYTEGTARYLCQRGVPETKITAVQNSIDTRRIQQCVRNFSPNARAALRARLGISVSAPVGVFVGMLHKVKSVPFLIEAGERIRRTIPEFQLLVVGGGPDEQEIKRNAARCPWIHFAGPKFGDRKAELLAIADLFLLPGRVGLAVLDGFAAGLPLIATRRPIHGPEIEYFEHGRNGLMTDPDPEAYACAITGLLSNPRELQFLREGAAKSAGKYSIEAMVENFADGILRCLRQTKRKWAVASGPRSEEPSRPVAGVLMHGDAKGIRSFSQDHGAILQRQPVLPLSSSADKPAELCITTSWDDGHPLDFRIAELLAKYGLSGTFYVPRASQRQVITVSQVRTLSNTFEIGAHTLDHETVERSTDEETRGQLFGSRQWVEEITGKRCEVFCFPGGKFKARQLRLVREAGFHAVRTVELLSIAEPRLVDGLQIISTTIQAFPHPRFAYLKNAAKRLPYSGLVPLKVAMYGGDWVALAKDLLARTIARGGVFHLWGHSWEIDEQNQWRQLEEVLALLGSCKTNAKSVTNGELRARAA